jgi:hypothetical protein
VARTEGRAGSHTIGGSCISVLRIGCQFARLVGRSPGGCAFPSWLRCQGGAVRAGQAVFRSVRSRVSGVAMPGTNSWSGSWESSWLPPPPPPAPAVVDCDDCEHSSWWHVADVVVFILIIGGGCIGWVVHRKGGAARAEQNRLLHEWLIGAEPESAVRQLHALMEPRVASVTVMEPADAPALSLAPVPPSPVTATSSAVGQKAVITTSVLPSSTVELPLQEGQEVTVLDTASAHWWRVRCGEQEGFVSPKKMRLLAATSDDAEEGVPPSHAGGAVVEHSP